MKKLLIILTIGLLMACEKEEIFEPPVYFHMTESGRQYPYIATAELSDSITIPIYHKTKGIENLYLHDTIYADPACTIPVIGNSQDVHLFNWKNNPEPERQYFFRVNGDGKLTGFGWTYD